MPCNSHQTVKAQPIKETREGTGLTLSKKAPAEPSKLIRKPITLANFLLPLTVEEDELQISNCNRISRLGHYLPSKGLDGEWVPL